MGLEVLDDDELILVQPSQIKPIPKEEEPTIKVKDETPPKVKKVVTFDEDIIDEAEDLLQ